MNKRNRAVLLGILMLCTFSGLYAVEPEMLRYPWQAPLADVPDGAFLITVGFWADCLGYGLIVGGGVASGSLDLSVGIALVDIGCLSFMIGNICLQRGLTAHQKGAVEKGYTITNTGNAKKARRFSIIALGLQGAAVGTGIMAAGADSAELGITSLVLGAGGAVIEMINFYIFRKGWGEDLMYASKPVSSLVYTDEDPELEYTPFVTMTVDERSGGLLPCVGLKIAY